MEEKEKASTTVDIDKELLLKFKSICVLKEVTMSDIIEELVREWVAKNETKPGPAEVGESVEEEEKNLPPAPGPEEAPSEEISDELEEETEKA
jgi:hypothetical protein